MKKPVLVLLALLGTGLASGQDLPPTEKVLVPIFFEGEVAGGYGSRWTAQLVVTNRGDSPIGIGGIMPFLSCPFDPCEWPPNLLPPLLNGSTLFAVSASPVTFPPSSLLLVEEGRIDELSISLRIQDVSRQALTWGTEIPVVPESEAFTGSSDLLNVPVDFRFRVLLRVYSFDPATGQRVLVTGYAIDPNERYVTSEPQEVVKVFETHVDLAPPSAVAFKFPYAVPGYGQLDLATLAPFPPDVERLRIRVEPEDASFAYWAFLSVTNNETQHVTTIVPD